MEKDTNDTSIKCPNCDGRGFYSVDYHLAEEEMHCVCEDCIGKGTLDVEETKKV